VTDDAIDRLKAAIARAGMGPVHAPGPEVEREIAEVAAAVAPLRLPDQLVALWRRVDAASLPCLQSPRVEPPALALQNWRDNVDAGVTPRVMFPACYESHWFLMVELEDGHGHGGAVFDWSFGALAYELRHVDVDAWLNQEATVLELHQPGEDWVNYHEGDVWEQMCAVRLAAHLPILGYGHQTAFVSEAEHWPQHWLTSNGITADNSAPRGATTTVAELLAAAAAGREVSGTIQALITTLAMNGEGQQITVDDGTGSLAVWCPRGLSPYGPVHQRRFEFDVTVHRGRTPIQDTSAAQREVTRLALSGDLAGAAELLSDMAARTFDTPRAATATALRPLQ
jgi:hypothetical protein